MNVTDLSTLCAAAFAAAQSAQAAHDDVRADAHDAEGWAAFDRAVAAPAKTRADLRGKIALARAMLARECPEQADRMLASLISDLPDA